MQTLFSPPSRLKFKEGETKSKPSKINFSFWFLWNYSSKKLESEDNCFVDAQIKKKKKNRIRGEMSKRWSKITICLKLSTFIN